MSLFPNDFVRGRISDQIVSSYPASTRDEMRSRVYRVLERFDTAESQLAILLLYAADQSSTDNPVFDRFLGQCDKFYFEKLEEITPDDRERDVDDPFTVVGKFFFDWEQALQKDPTRRN